MHNIKPYMGATKDYTLKESEIFKQLLDKYVRLGYCKKNARILAAKKEQEIKKKERYKKVIIKYKQSKELKGKIFKITRQHIALKLKPEAKPIWLDRRYIELIKVA